MREKLIQILTGAKDIIESPLYVGRAEKISDAILSKLRCENCSYWDSLARTENFALCLHWNGPVNSQDDFFCAHFKTKEGV